MADLFWKVQAANREQHWWHSGAKLVVAVSGGPDSLCLLHLLRRFEADGLQLHVAHLNHGLRPQAAADAAFVAATAADWGLPVTVGERDVAALAQQQHSGFEAAARQARYAFLRDVATAVGTDDVALGHTADDQAETVLLRLLRGAGPTGLAAMRPRTELATGLVLLRPLLAITREEIEAYCAAHGLLPRQDASNTSPLFVRNRVRATLLPAIKTYNPHIVQTLGRTATVCADEDAYIRSQLDHLWPELVIQAGDHQVVLDRLAFRNLPRALQRRALRRAMELLGGLTEVGADHTERMLVLAQQEHGRLQLPGGRWLRVRPATLSIEQGVDE
ncbi:MAG: tRNA lysidine(34) synthetase TilS [Herpetosiphonaceae bacterium]|nr:tRNA lysidine(34) synthetase TilS [Herpetosiphonaceae bacterium]